MTQSIDLPRLEPLKTVRAGVLDVAFYDADTAGGDPVLLLHGFPYDIHSYIDVAPLLADAGLRVIVPSPRCRPPWRPASGTRITSPRSTAGAASSPTDA